VNDSLQNQEQSLQSVFLVALGFPALTAAVIAGLVYCIGGREALLRCISHDWHWSYFWGFALLFIGLVALRALARKCLAGLGFDLTSERIQGILAILGFLAGLVAAVCGAAYYIGGSEFLLFAISRSLRWNLVWEILLFIAGTIVVIEISRSDRFQSIQIDHLGERLFALLLSLVVGGILVAVPLNDFWTRYWVKRDTRQTKAVITDYVYKDAVEYRYRVAGREYSGQVRIDVTDPRHAKASVGSSLTIHYSDSHPALSTVDPPKVVFDGEIFMAMLLGYFEVRLLAMVFFWSWMSNGQKRSQAPKPK
jgi:hypothetical protein